MNFKTRDKFTMKQFTILISLITLTIISACGSNNDEEQQAYFDSNDEFTELLKSLNEQFTENAGYQSIMLSFDERMGNTVLVKVSRNIEDNNIEEWFFMNENWKKEAESKLELDDKKSSDFLFSLKDDYDLSILLGLVNESKEKVKEELKVKKVVCKSVNLIMRRDSASANKMDDLITQVAIEPEAGGATYNLSYDATGKYLDMIH